ncbi:MAG: hypothetical protein ACOYK8_08495 [Alphaproteobacteria bacterium]
MTIAEEDQLTIIVDTSFFLTAGHYPLIEGDETSFINQQLLLALAELPSIKAIIFPSLVADWGLMGKFTDKDGNPHQIRHKDTYGEFNRDAMEWFFAQCQRGTIVKNKGNYTIENTPEPKRFFYTGGMLDAEKNPKLWILQTKDQGKLIKRTMNSITSAGHTSISAVQNILGENCGERASLEIAQQLPWAGQAMILSEDKQYCLSFITGNDKNPKLLGSKFFTPFNAPIVNGRVLEFLGTLSGKTRNPKDQSPNLGTQNLINKQYFSAAVSRQVGAPVAMEDIVAKICLQHLSANVMRLETPCGVFQYQVPGQAAEEEAVLYSRSLSQYLQQGIKEMPIQHSLSNHFNGEAVTTTLNPIPLPKPIIKNQPSNVM